MLSRQIDGVDVHYVASGAGETVMLIHGSFSDMRYWTYQFEPFSQHYAVVAPSMRPYWPNPSPTTESVFDVLNFVRDIGGFIDSLNVGKVHLCGHSLGGHVALRVAKDFPHLVHSLVLAEPGGPLASPPVVACSQPAPPTAIPDIIGIAAAKIRDGDVEGAFDFIFSINGASAWDTLPDFYRDIARANAGTLRAQATEQRPSITPEDIAGVRQPVLLIGGETTPQPFPRILDTLEAQLRNVRRVTIPCGTHLMNIDNPTAFNDAVMKFWKSMPMPLGRNYER